MVATTTRGLLDCPPRFGTRRTSRPTLGGQASIVAARLRRPFMPWQQYVADVGLELNPDGSLVYGEVDLVGGRQIGKTELKFTVAVTRLTAMVAQLGPQRVTYTMQDRKRARTRLERDYAPRLRRAAGFTEIPPQSRVRPRRLNEWRLGMNSGVEHIQFGVDSFLQIDTPSRTGGHGDTLDLGMIDEAFAHRDGTVELGMEPAMLTRAAAQLWVMSAAGDATSFYLWRKVVRGRKLIEDGGSDAIAYFEWSAPDDDDPGDPRTWERCCPGLGHTITEAKLAALWRKALEGGPDDVDAFRRSYLCQWPEVPALEEASSRMDFDIDAWALLADAGAPRGTKPVFGVDVGVDRLAHVAVAWRRSDGAVQVMLADTGLSPLRTPGRLAKIAGEWKGPVMLGGPSASLEADVPRAQLVSSSEFAAACGRFDDLLRDEQIRHGNQPELNEAVRSARWRLFGASGERSLQLKDAPAVGPLAAVVRALHGLLGTAEVPAAKPRMERSSVPRGGADLSTIGF